jgi:uncharacterized protein (DUF1330 family)
MSYEMTVGLFVIDRKKYSDYRAEIAPLLEASRAGFRFDFEVARQLKTEAGSQINRLFVIRFPDRASKDSFFADPRYLEVRARLF